MSDAKSRRFTETAERRLHLDRRAAEIIANTEGADDDLLSTRSVAIWLGVSEEWVEIGRSKGYGPPFIRLGPRRIRYHRRTILDWLAARSFTSTEQYPAKSAA